MNLGSFKKYSPLFDLATDGSPSYLSKIVLMNAHQIYQIGNPDIGFSVFSTKAKHHEMITTDYALGFVFKLGDRTIRLTGDTGWSSELEADNIKSLSFSNFCDNIDVLIAHIGSIKPEEFNYDIQNSLSENEKKSDDDRVFYKNHLGILGCICMMAKWRPKITILTEFGEELAELRTLIPQMLKPMNMCTLVSDIGMCINLNDLTVLCQKSGQFFEPNEIEAYADSSNQLKFMKLSDIDKANASKVARETLIPDIPKILTNLFTHSDTEHKVRTVNPDSHYPIVSSIAYSGKSKEIIS